MGGGGGGGSSGGGSSAAVAAVSTASSSWPVTVAGTGTTAARLGLFFLWSVVVCFLGGDVFFFPAALPRPVDEPLLPLLDDDPADASGWW